MKKCIDFFGKDASELINKKLFLFDMDGTIYEENRLFDGTLELLSHIKSIGGKYVFITNNSSKAVVDYIEKVSKYGIEVNISNFFTSTQATIEYLKRNRQESIVYCQGTTSMVRELLEAGIKIVTEVDTRADVVLIGFDTELTSLKLRNTCEMLQKNVLYLATNPDLVCPVSFGFIPDCGSICAMIKNATGKEPHYIGKPEPMMVSMVAKKLGYSPDEVCVIGDRLYTDILVGINAGVTSICVLTGEATVEDIRYGHIKPSYTFAGVNEIYQALQFL